MYPFVEIDFVGTDCDYMSAGPTVRLECDVDLYADPVVCLKTIAPLLVDCYQISGKRMSRTMADAVIAMWMAVGSASNEMRAATAIVLSAKLQKIDAWHLIFDSTHNAEARVHIAFDGETQWWNVQFFYSASGFDDLAREVPRFSANIENKFAMRVDCVELILRTKSLRDCLDKDYLGYSKEPLTI